MPRRKKPADIPAPPNFEKSYADLLIDSPAERKRIARLLPRISDYRAFRRDVVDVSHWTHMELYERKRSNQKAVYAALDDLHSKLESAHRALLDLGYDGSEALYRRAARRIAQDPDRNGEDIWQRLETLDRRPSGAARIQWLVCALADGVRWAAEARAFVGKPGTITIESDSNDPRSAPRRRGGGRPRGWAAENALHRLIGIWEEQTDGRPTIVTDPKTGHKSGHFLEFSEAILVPIYQAMGLKPPGVGALAQKLLYPPRGSGRD